MQLFFCFEVNSMILSGGQKIYRTVPKVTKEHSLLNHTKYSIIFQGIQLKSQCTDKGNIIYVRFQYSHILTCIRIHSVDANLSKDQFKKTQHMYLNSVTESKSQHKLLLHNCTALIKTRIYQVRILAQIQWITVNM